MFVYKITNQINKKCYIGSTKDPEKRKLGALLKQAQKDDIIILVMLWKIRKILLLL